MTAINNEFYSTKRTRPCCLAISLNPGIKGKQNFDVCKAFLNKNVCLKVAEYYTWAYEGDGAAVLGIAQVIYAHALIFYESDKILNVLSGIKKTNPSLYKKPMNTL